MATEGILTLNRDTSAIKIPEGTTIILPKGMEVWITQSLGGSHTVSTNDGRLVRIAGKDADALGLEVTAAPAAPAPTSEGDVKTLVWEHLKTVYDPEIPVNVVDLGLVYLCETNPLQEGGYEVNVQMTLTAPGCGMGDVLRSEAENKILTIPGVKRANVVMVMDPPWDQSKISEAGKLQLGLL